MGWATSPPSGGTHGVMDGEPQPGLGGGPDALGQLFEACRPYLNLVAGRRIDPALSAKGGISDVVQETYLEAHRDFDRFHGRSEADLLAWLRGLLLNNLADHARRFRSRARCARREVRLDGGAGPGPHGTALEAPDETPSRQLLAAERSEAIAQAVRRLPEAHRRAVVMRSHERRSFAEIGAELGRSEEAARKLWFRAVERLREDLGIRNGP